MAGPQDNTARATGFLDLPPELRNRIYKIHFTTTAYLDFPGRARFRNNGLLLACKQTHAEATVIYYKQTLFYTCNNMVSAQYLSKLSPTNRNMIQNYHMKVEGDSTGLHGRVWVLSNHLTTLQTLGAPFGRAVLKVDLRVDGKTGWVSLADYDGRSDDQVKELVRARM